MKLILFLFWFLNHLANKVNIILNHLNDQLCEEQIIRIKENNPWKKNMNETCTNYQDIYRQL